LQVSIPVFSGIVEKFLGHRWLSPPRKIAQAALQLFMLAAQMENDDIYSPMKAETHS